MKELSELPPERQRFLVSLPDHPRPRPFRVLCDRYPEKKWAQGPHCRVPDHHPAARMFRKMSAIDDDEIQHFLVSELRCTVGFDDVDPTDVDEGLNVATWPKDWDILAKVREWAGL